MKNSDSKITAVIVLIYLSAVMLFIFFGNGNDRTGIYVGSCRKSYCISVSDVMDGSYMEYLTERAASRLPARSRMIAADSRLKSAMNESIVNGVCVDSSMLLDAEVSDRGSTTKNARIINEFCGNYKGAVYFAAIPTSSGVYESRLPEYMRKNPESLQISSFYGELEGNIREIDAYNILKMLNEKYMRLFHGYSIQVPRKVCR